VSASGPEVGDLKSGWRLSIEGGVEVGLETTLQHALKEEVDGG
jgi:hypothetical protein